LGLRPPITEIAEKVSNNFVFMVFHHPKYHFLPITAIFSHLIFILIFRCNAPMLRQLLLFNQYLLVIKEDPHKLKLEKVSWVFRCARVAEQLRG